MFGKKKRQEKLKIEKLKKTISSTQMGRGASKNRQDAKKELNRMGHLTDRQKSQKDRKDRKDYDKEHTIKNKRGRTTGYKEGYDPSKGVKGSGSKTKTTTKVKGRKLSPYEQKQAERKEALRARAKKKHEAWKASKGRK